MALVILLAACGGQTQEGPSPVAGQPGAFTVRGRVVDLEEVPQEGSALPAIVGFTLTTDGTTLRFELGEEVDETIWNALHFQGHLRSGEAVGVEYEETAVGLVARRLSE